MYYTMKGVYKFCRLAALLSLWAVMSVPTDALAQNVKDESGVSDSSFADQICGVWVSNAYGDALCGYGSGNDTPNLFA